MNTQIAISSTIPEGMMENRKGHYVHIDSIDPIDIARTELVEEFYQKAVDLQQSMIEVKRGLFGDFDAFVKLSAEKYNVELGGVKGNVTLTSFDGKTKIQLTQQDRFDYDERLNTAKVLIDEFFSEVIEQIEGALALSDDEINVDALANMKQIKSIIDDVFQVGKKGRINLSRILGLRHYKFKHQKWETAMEAIADSIHTDGTTPYIRVYSKNSQGKFKPVVLDFAGI